MLIIRTIMKREIKFRGKRVKTEDPLERWIEGSYVEYTNIRDEKIIKIMSQSGYMNDINPETVCQFSEITDKNGNSIFEHDLILIHDSESSYQFTVEVLFHKGMFCYRNKACGFTPLWYVSDRCEVIGNVFDNPELLKGSK
jgi:uncharacterized phage protein (TIGR01671 family)